MFKAFLAARLTTVVLLGVMFLWTPSALDVVYDVNGAMWSPVIDLMVQLVPEPKRTALQGVLDFLEFGSAGAEWAAGVIPWYGEDARSILRLILHGSGILVTITLGFVVAWIVRKYTSWRRRKRRQEKIEPAF